MEIGYLRLSFKKIGLLTDFAPAINSSIQTFLWTGGASANPSWTGTLDGGTFV